MSSFLKNHLPELLAYSAAKIKQNPNAGNVIASHYALLELGSLDSNNVSNNCTGDSSQKHIAAIKILEETAKEGDAFSLLAIGMLKLEGFGAIVPQDQPTGHACIQVAAFQGFSLAIIAKGVLSAQQQDWLVAKESFLQALSIAPNNVRVLRNLGICCLQSGEYHEAIAYLKQAQVQGDDTLSKVYQLILSQDGKNKPEVSNQDNDVNINTTLPHNNLPLPQNLLHSKVKNGVIARRRVLN